MIDEEASEGAIVANAVRLAARAGELDREARAGFARARRLHYEAECKQDEARRVGEQFAEQVDALPASLCSVCFRGAQPGEAWHEWATRGERAWCPACLAVVLERADG